MNILLLANHLDTGGITSYLLTIAKGLKSRGHSVFVASSGGNRVTRFTEQGIVFVPIPIRTKSEVNLFKLLPSFFILRRLIRENAIDIVHANTRVTQVLAALLGKKAGVPYVSTCHGFFKPRFFRKLLPCLGRKVIAISDSVGHHLKNDFRVPGKDIRLVYSGVDSAGLKLETPKNRQDVRESFGLGAGPVVGIVARLSDVKGHVFLVQAFKSVISRVPDAQLMIVGEGKMEKTLRAMVRELDISRNVFFFPEITSIREAYYAIDVFVMPSLNEGLGLGLMEAMAWGKPVVGSAVGGIVNLVKDGENGLLVRPADSGGLAQAIVRLLETPDLAATLGNNARIFISENFSAEQMVAGTERVYEECVKTV